MTSIDRLKSKKGKKWLVLYFILVINMIFIELIILMIQPYRGSTNLYVSELIVININLIFIVMIIVGLPMIYGFFLIYKGLKELARTNELKPHMINKILPIILLIIFNIVVVLLVELLDEYSQLIFQVLEFYSIYIFIGVWFCLILGIYPLIKFLPNFKNKFSNRSVSPRMKVKLLSIVIIIGYFGVGFLPFLNNIANVINHDVPTKPEIIGHRGGAQLGPENTIETVEYAMNFGIVGWEVDIRISYDGIPFLMHDNNLKRTTNVEEVFPSRIDNMPESFTIAELKQLDAGTWFVEKDYYGTIANGVISSQQAELYKGIKIPTFEEVLNFTRDQSLIIDFDTEYPPDDNPYQASFTELLFKITIDSEIELNKIMIAKSSNAWLNLIDSKGITDIRIYQNNDNKDDEYIKKQYYNFYSNENSKMVFNTNSIGRFKEIWSLGVKWVKTDVPHLFVNVDTPIWALRLELYALIWILFYATAGILFVVLELKSNKSKTITTVHTRIAKQ